MTTIAQRIVQYMQANPGGVTRPQLAGVLSADHMAVEMAVRRLEFEHGYVVRTGSLPPARRTNRRGGSGGRWLVVFELADVTIDMQVLGDRRGRPRGNRTLIERASDAAQGMAERSGLDMWLFGRVTG